ncbi:hypothetical protein [Spirosoma fluviale]|uniref:Uncharacterized protein n=1 Tax=Spirosoma fluviale TaxID=1597977 RepID=A0A286GBE5_9BACT|nr:hypothetical protein [Spirosoma fluviale]SOD92830.1 hypothetical protein SAMN06269250_4208 [Spirosoma fluviale]
MQATQEKYPVFEANQVLTNEHLNQLFIYLDEQERLTRANLIGIGIVCGFDLSYDEVLKTIRLSKGCGITSAGYLMVQQQDLELVSYRKVTEDLAYPLFKNTNPVDLDPALNTQYDVWELFPKDEPNVKPLDSPANFLKDKALVLFLELKNAKLRNCSPNNCDDKGAEINISLRPMLIQQKYLIKLIAKENQLNTTVTAAELETALLARLNLPDLRLPRYDVPNTSPATSNDVLAAFQAVFKTDKIVTTFSKALAAAYTAFKPVLQTIPDPSVGFNAKFGFLEQVPASTGQVRFLQYYYDFFDDLIRGYDEFCRKGLELMCACCPPEGLFPRHLMVGLLYPAANAGVYRHGFKSSSAVSGCEEREQELRLLFRRLATMIERFTPTPPLPALSTGSPTDTQIRITPSKLSDAPLSEKAIPYYYQQTGTTPLFQLWNPEKTRRNRANQNLSYRAAEYVPAAPTFVTNPLRYDLEPYNFLRIEGHLGKSYQSVLTTLLSLKTQYRLPIDVIALRTGAFDETMPVDLTKEKARFQDLEAVYDAFREELLSSLAEGARTFYDQPINGKDPGGKPQLPLLKQYAPNYSYKTGSLGAWYEKYRAQLQAIPYIDVDQNNINAGTILTVYCGLFIGTTAPAPEFQPRVVAVYYLSKLAEILPASLDQLKFTDFQNKYQDLIELARYFRTLEASDVPKNLEQFLPKEDLIDQFDQILFTCKLEPIRSLIDEYKKRLKELKQKQFLSNFLQNNPGIQHKAGVPLGGTFILVYHDDPEPVVSTAAPVTMDFLQPVFFTPVFNVQETATFNPATNEPLAQAFKRISKNQALTDNEDVRFVMGTLFGIIPPQSTGILVGQEDPGKKIIDQAVNELADGTVIADFYLPYLFSGGGTPVQFVLPKVKPSFTYTVGCTKANDKAEVTLKPQGGVPPYSVKVDDEGYKPLDGVLSLSVGSRKISIQDAETTESEPQTIKIEKQLVLDEPTYTCLAGGNTYTATLTIKGGKAPYKAEKGTITNTNQYTSEVLPGDVETTIKITDSQGCEATKVLQKSCLPPLAFTVEIACTTPNNVAPVTITPTGGKKPYQVQIDQGAAVAVKNPFSLTVGPHTLLVTDSVGEAAPPQTINVPAVLTLSVGETDYRCEAGTYRAVVRVSGGTPPYFYKRATDELEFNDLVFVTDPVPSGQETTVVVRDSSKCEPAKLTTNHTCCDLPCDGQSRRSAYRLWVQPVTDFPRYNDFKQQSLIQFRFNGKGYELPDTKELLQQPADSLNTKFQDTIGGIIKKLNSIINETLTNDLGELGKRRLVLTYKPSADDPFGVMMIEHFVCDTFMLEFNYSIDISEQQYDLNIRYTNEPDVTGAPFDGVILTNQKTDKIAHIPAFNYAERNQCLKTDYKPECDGPKPVLESRTVGRRATSNRLLINAAFAGQVANMDPRDILGWIWDVPLAAEPVYLGEKIDGIQLRRADLPVRLTAITTKGCFNILDSQIQLS